MTDGLLPLYLRKERRPHSEAHLAKYLPRGIPVVAYYRDAEATQRACVNPWPSRPTRRNRYVMLNCCRWRAVWLPDLEG